MTACQLLNQSTDKSVGKSSVGLFWLAADDGVVILKRDEQIPVFALIVRSNRSPKVALIGHTRVSDGKQQCSFCNVPFGSLCRSPHSTLECSMNIDHSR